MRSPACRDQSGSHTQGEAHPYHRSYKYPLLVALVATVRRGPPRTLAMCSCRSQRTRHSWRLRHVQLPSHPDSIASLPKQIPVSPERPAASTPSVPAQMPLSPEHQLRVGFYSNHLCERGSEVALYDYADFAEQLRGSVSYILYDANSPKNVDVAVRKFTERFGERVIALGKVSGFAPRDIANAIEQRCISHCYIIKYGHRDEPNLRWFGQKVRTCVHAVFDATQPHGDVYARISPCVPWQTKTKPGRKPTPVPVVPHVVRPFDATGPDLRAELRIPSDAIVFGRHGGEETFNVPEALAAVARVAQQRPDIFFLLLNTRRFLHHFLPKDARAHSLPNVIHLEATADDARKAAFIRTCDAMLHARLTGETFGLAIAEFSAANKPVITSRIHHECGMANFHLQALGARGLCYHDQPSCEKLLLTFDKHAVKGRDWNAYRAFAPDKVMRTFWDVFIDRETESAA